MTTQKPISKSPISDAFLSKNAEGDCLANSCFCERYVDDFSFPFTGKEKDPETGYSYFGARYLDHELTTAWLSVDPQADKYPSISPYAYCAWNPVRLVDPDGNWPWNPKHIRKARRFARHTDGKLTVFTNIDGTKLATVTYTNRPKEGEHIFSIALFQPEGYSVHGTLRPASGASAFELWIESPSEKIGEAFKKGVVSFFYSIPNDAWVWITGHTLAGSERPPTERGEAFVSTVSSLWGSVLKSTNIITTTDGMRGLKGYNEYVRKNPGILKKYSRKEVGRMYKNNIELQQMYTDFNISTNITQAGKEVRKNVPQ